MIKNPILSNGSRRLVSAALFAAVFATGITWGEEIKLSALGLTDMTMGRGERGITLSGNHRALSINGRSFVRGVGIQAQSMVTIGLCGSAKRFTAPVGVDDETGGDGSVEFSLIGDGKPLWTSGIIRGKDAAKTVDVGVTGVKKLTLNVGNTKDGQDFDHADWGDARFVKGGQQEDVRNRLAVKRYSKLP
jgi:hypothetical protein